jgi:predicted enzyme related to lactoylglutathione lyase
MAAAAIVYVKDLARMRAFYERCFGLSVAADGDDEFCILASHDWELSLVALPEAVAATVVVSDPPARREQSPIKLAFAVASIEGLRAVVTNAGGHMDPIESTWEFRSRRHLDCVDPEGNVVQLRERVPQP